MQINLKYSLASFLSIFFATSTVAIAATVENSDNNPSNSNASQSTSVKNEADDGKSNEEKDPQKSWEDLFKLGESEEKNSDFQKAKEHFEKARELSKSFEPGDPRSLKTLKKLSKVYRKLNDYNSLIEVLSKAKSEINLLPSTPKTKDSKLKISYKLADTLYDAGMPLDSLKEALEAHKILLESSTNDLYIEPRIYRLLGATYIDTGEPDKGKDYLEKALSLIELSCPKLPLDKGVTKSFNKHELKSLFLKGRILAAKAYQDEIYPAKQNKELCKKAMLYMKTGLNGKPHEDLLALDLEVNFNDVDKLSLEKLQNKLKQSNQDFGKNSIASARIKLLIADRQGYQNKFDQTFKTLTELKKALLTQVPSNSSHIAALSEYLGHYYEQQRKYVKGASEVKEAYDRVIKSCGRKSPLFSSTASLLGSMYYDDKQYGLAEKYYLEAWKIDEKLFGKNNLAVLSDINNLGVVYSDWNRPQKAAQFLYWNYQITEKLFGKDSPKLAIAANNLASLYMERDNISQAGPYIKLALKLEAKRGKHTPAYAMLVRNMGLYTFLSGHASAALPYYKQALAIQEKSLGLTHRVTYKTISDYHKLLKHLGRIAEAQTLSSRYKKALYSERKKASRAK